MSQAALGQIAVRVECPAKRRSNRVRTRTVVRRLQAQTNSTGHLYQRLSREMNRAQKAYLNIIAEQEHAIHKVAGRVDAAYQRYDLATRAFDDSSKRGLLALLSNHAISFCSDR